MPSENPVQHFACTEHQLRNGSLAKSVGNDLEAAALLDDPAFKQIRGSDRPAGRHREPQVRNGSFEVVQQSGLASRQVRGQVTRSGKSNGASTLEPS